MLVNDKVLINNGKILKGIHLESYIYTAVNATSVNVYYSTNGVSERNPLYLYFYDDYGDILSTVTTDQTENFFRYTSSSSSSYKYFMAYGNLDALTYVRFNYIEASGDIKGFLDTVPSLEELETYGDNFSTSMSNYTWPANMKSIDITDSDMTGDIATMAGLDNLEKLHIDNANFGGDIKSLDKLTYLNVNAYYVRNCISSSIDEWNFFDKLTYAYLYFTEGVDGDMTNLSFSTGLTNLTMYKLNQPTGNISNWDFSSCSSINTIFVEFSYTNASSITGSLSGWTLPDNRTMSAFRVNYAGITDASIDLSNLTSITYFQLYNDTSASNEIGDIKLPNDVSTIAIDYCYNIDGDISGFTFPRKTSSISIRYSNVSGDIINEINGLDTGTTRYLYFSSNDMSGDISGLTLWEGLSSIDISDNDGINGNLSSSVTIPTTLNTAILSATNIVLDLTSTVDFQQVQRLYLSGISGVTGSFSNMTIDNVGYLYFGSNTFSSDIGDLPVNWDKIVEISMPQTTSSNSDLTDWFPSGHTTTIHNLNIRNSTVTADITNWHTGNWGTSSTYTTLYFDGSSNITGSISNWGTAMPRTISIYNSGVGGDVGAIDFATNESMYMTMYNTSLSGDLSGVTLAYRAASFYINNCSSVTGTDSFIDYIWTNRKNWTGNLNVRMDNIGDSITGTYQLGDTGTYPTGTTNYAWDLTEAELNNLVAGNDYDGNGTNTAWSQNEKRYYMLNAMVSSSSTQKRYKINSITV